MKKKVLITDVVNELGVEKKVLKNFSLILENINKIDKEKLKTIDGIITGHSINFDKNLLKYLKNCKAIVRYGAGYNNVDILFAKKLGIKVFNVPDYGSKEVADQAVAMTMSFLKNLNDYYFKIISKDRNYWNYLNGFIHRRLNTLKIGVVGLGKIGLNYAKKMKGLGSQIFYFDPYLKKKHPFVKVNSLSQLFNLCDVISLHVPLTSETKFFIDDKLFKKRKKGLILINVARGEIIKEKTIIQNIKKNKILCYGADVLEQEPIKFNSVLFKLLKNNKYKSRFLITPHSAFYTKESFYDLRFKASKSLFLFFKNGLLKNCVNI